MKKRERRTAVAVAFLLLLIASPATGGPPSPGAPAPDFRLSDADGRTVRLSDLRGDVVILHFWATWCPHCVAEMPLLQEVARDYDPRGVRVLAINLGEPRKRVARYLDEHSLDLRVLFDARGRVAEKYGVVGLPATIVVDPEGRVLRQITMGSLDRAQIDDLVNRASREE